MYFNTSDKHTPNIILNIQKLKGFPLHQEQDKDAYPIHFYST